MNIYIVYMQVLVFVDGEEDSRSDDLLNVTYTRYVSTRHSILYGI